MPESQSSTHSCDRVLRAVPYGWATSGYRQDGERWTCDCGKVYVHVCDESEGCYWSLHARGRGAVRGQSSTTPDRRQASALAYINTYYKVDARIGGLVRFEGARGVIEDTRDHYLLVRFDENPAALATLHPTWHVEYVDSRCFCMIENPDVPKVRPEFCPIHGDHPLTAADFIERQGTE